MPDSAVLTARIALVGASQLAFAGTTDSALRRFEALFPSVKIVLAQGFVELAGRPDEVRRARSVASSLVQLARREVLTSADVDAAVALRSAEGGDGVVDLAGGTILTVKGRSIRPKTAGQKRYADAIDASTIVFGIGPAGTGKTYLAMAKAVQALQAQRVDRIVLTRPAVEAGERLGFLPGTLGEKIDPYLRPLFDAIGEMMDAETVSKLMEYGTIEVAPLAYMRGRTLNSSFVILDEAQNTTPEQMKMFLTRLGFGTTMVVTGDVTQVDLAGGRSGLRQVTGIVEGIEGISVCRLGAEDVVRNPLVGRIIGAYEARTRAEDGR